MDKVIKSFLSGIIDYAGMFPPARLSLEKALEEYKYYRHSEYDWMLSRFILSIGQFEALKDLSLKEDRLVDPFRISVTAPPVDTVEDYVLQIEKIKEAILGLHHKTKENIETKVLELRLPNSITKKASGDEVQQLIEFTAQTMGNHPQLPDCVFFEVPGFKFDANLTKEVVNAIAAQNQLLEEDNPEYYRYSGFKIRCGGVEAHMFPPSEYLAESILAAQVADVPLKFTAGLHHPIRLYHDSVKTKMYGFLNVFGSGVLAQLHNLDVGEIRKILEDENAESFKFTTDYFAWKDLKAQNSDIHSLRKKHLISYGSCSIAEPVEDLQALGLI